MSALAAYVERCRGRLRWLARLRISAIGLVLAAALTLVFALATAHLVPSAGWIVAARVTLYAVVVLALFAALRRRIGTRHATRHAERRVPAFDGRLATWHDAVRRSPPPVLLSQLAAEAEQITAGQAPARVVPAWLYAAPLAAILAAALALLWSLQYAPQGWRLPAQRLWLGETFSDTRPRIVVQPGDAVVPRGTDVLLSARAYGFAASTLRVNAAFAGAEGWERADMLPIVGDDERGQEFVLVAVTEPVSYFVSAGGVNSDRFRIDVADLPVVEGLALTLHYPAWTRLAAKRQDHGDVSGVEGTQVQVHVHASEPLRTARLVVDGEEIGLQDGVGRFTIERAGSWHVAVQHRDAVVRVSDEYFVDVVADEPPEVEFVFPGHDRSATRIEEVALRFQARDDFGVENMTLHYAINGSDWRSVAAPRAGQRETLLGHLFEFESLRAGDRALQPGDVLSFHVAANDHRQSTKSALYFVDVRSFEKRYRERQGNGGGGGGDNPLELSARQREIVAATWNLIRERDSGERSGDDLRDQVDTIALLQGTLKSQVETLVARAEGRRLSEDEQVEPFVAELDAAATAMASAEQTLAAHDLEGAISPEQRALQHLLTAEAGLRDIDITLSQGRGEGSASRSLAELVDLELDPERNRYETPQTPSFDRRGDSHDEDWRRLNELARRQEELARRQERGDSPAMPLSRWNLERLERELDTLRNQLAEQGEPSGDPRQGDGAGSGMRPGGAAGVPSERAAAESSGPALADIDRVRAAIERSLAGPNTPGSPTFPEDPNATAEVLRQGAAALRRGADALRRQAQGEIADQVREAERRADALLADQRRIVKRLDELQDDALEAARASRPFAFNDFALAPEAATKRRMQRDVTQLAADLADLRQRIANTAPDAARQLDSALDELGESRIGERLSVGAEYFEAGRPLFMIGQEAQVERALAQLARRIGTVAEELGNAGDSFEPGPAVDDVQALRRRLQQVGAGGDPAELRNIAEASGRLANAVAERFSESESSGVRALARETAARYRGRGASDANGKRLYLLTLAELDQIEIALGKVSGAAIRDQEIRDDAYDSAAVARYFRRLSCGAGNDC